MESILNKNTDDLISRIQDELSKKIYLLRVAFSKTNDYFAIREIVRLLPEGKYLFDKLNLWCDDEIYIFGAGLRGQALFKILPEGMIGGFIDNNPDKIGTEFCGLKVYSLNEICRRKRIIIANRWFYSEIENQIVSEGWSKDRIINIAPLWNRLIDEQYFDVPFIKSLSNEVFVDAGGFDGYDTVKFIKWADKNAEMSFIFEPDNTNVERCRKLFEGNDKVSVISKALWKQNSEMGYTGTDQAGVLSTLSNAERTVSTITLDEFLTDQKRKVSFIKMDIEGEERNALIGAKRTIKENKPKLAISVYHKYDDIFEIPRLIMEFRNDYKFYLRHYSMVEWDTVLYAV